MTPDRLDGLAALLSRIMQPTFIPGWIDRPNDAFDGRTPREAWESGDGHLIVEMVERIEQGTPG